MSACAYRYVCVFECMYICILFFARFARTLVTKHLVGKLLMTNLWSKLGRMFQVIYVDNKITRKW